jgi:hypothetical protein
MATTNKKLISKFLISALMLITVNINVFSRIVHNGSGSGYDGGSGGSSVNSSQISNITNSIEGYIIEGAGFYLKGTACIQSLLHRVELQDANSIDNAELTQLVNNALDNISKARETFEKLIETAESTPYNPVVIDRLNRFDYETFMTNNSLNPVIFKELGSYLSHGDITGTFTRSYFSFSRIELLLLSIKSGLSMNRMPVIQVFWELNEVCAETTLFGSYAARVFHEIN